MSQTALFGPHAMSAVRSLSGESGQGTTVHFGRY